MNLVHTSVYWQLGQCIALQWLGGRYSFTSKRAVMAIVSAFSDNLSAENSNFLRSSATAKTAFLDVWCWLNYWCDTRVTLERTLDMLRTHVPWRTSNGRANVIFDQTGVTWTPLGPLQLHQSWKRISGVFQPNFVLILSVIIHTICFYVDCYLLILILTFTLVFNHNYSA